MKVGDSVKFWSNRVFGVPVQGKILKIKPNGHFVVEAYFYGNTWTAKNLHPARILT